MCANMVNKQISQITLDEHQANLISGWPEDGMGYHMVDITLRDGHTIRGATVVNSMYVTVRWPYKVSNGDIIYISRAGH